MEAYTTDIGPNIIKEIVDFIDQKSYLIERIRDRSKFLLLYRSPMIFVIYFLAYNNPYETEFDWPLTLTELAPIYSDLGISNYKWD